MGIVGLLAPQNFFAQTYLSIQVIGTWSVCAFGGGGLVNMIFLMSEHFNKHKDIRKVQSYVSSFILRATALAHGSSQPRGRTGAAAVGLCHSHSNAGSEPRLRPTLQLAAMPGP